MPIEPEAAPAKPSLRGVLHQWAAPMALGAGAVLAAMAPTHRARLASGVFALSLVTLFSVSATYHRVTWAPRARAWMRRADHASIFLLIAGTYTPISLLGLRGASGPKLALIVWGGAILGVLQSLFWVHAPKVLTALLCLALGWSVAPYLGELRQTLTTTELVLIMGAGVPYTLGAFAYAFKRPDLKPGVFGYHELFHALTIVAAAMHYAAVILLVRAAR